jgi:hypothetical protein
MKTLKLIDKYIRLLEQDMQPVPQQSDQTAEAPPVDATDVATQPEEPEVLPLTSMGEKRLIMLLVQAFEHSPTEQELEIVDAIDLEFKETNPKEVVSTILRLLNSTSTGDKEMIDRIDNQ